MRPQQGSPSQDAQSRRPHEAPARKPQEAPGSSMRPKGPMKHQEAQGGARKPQEAQEATGGPRRHQEACMVSFVGSLVVRISRGEKH